MIGLVLIGTLILFGIAVVVNNLMIGLDETIDDAFTPDPQAPHWVNDDESWPA